MIQLVDQAPSPTGDIAELRAIYHHLFEDVQEWEDEIRTVDLRKSLAGAKYFLPVSMISRSVGYIADELRADASLRGMARDRFIERLAYH